MYVNLFIQGERFDGDFDRFDLNPSAIGAQSATSHKDPQSLFGFVSAFHEMLTLLMESIQKSKEVEFHKLNCYVGSKVSTGAPIRRNRFNR